MMWFGVMYWNPAIPPIAAVSIEILEGNRIVLLNWIVLIKLQMMTKKSFDVENISIINAVTEL